MFSWITPSHIRTFVPSFVGSGISYLLAHDVVLNHYLPTLDKNYPSWRFWISSGVTTVCIGGYYSLARYLGKKSPKLEKLLLGALPPAQV